MKKILCPTDFSKSAENGIAYAAKLAKSINASVHILHVDLLSDLTPEEALLGVGMDEDILAQRLEKECMEVSTVFKISCYPEEPRHGMSLAREIARVAGNFDMIVMGTNGEDGFSQDLFGSNTYRVMRKTNIPLLMIPEGCGYTQVQHIVFAYDFWRNDNIPIETLLSLARSLQAKITMVQVMEAYSRDAEVELLAQQKVIRKTYEGDVDISFEVLYDDDVSEAINQFVMRVGADLLAMRFHPGSFQKIFYGGIVRRVTTETAYPLLVFH